MGQELNHISIEVCNAMLATIQQFPPPSQTFRPAQPHPDDRKRIKDRRVFYDEPLMRNLISTFDEATRTTLKATADRERARLPLFPAHFYSCRVPPLKCSLRFPSLYSKKVTDWFW